MQNKLKAAACACLLALNAGCGQRYGKLDAFSGTGYRQVELGFGIYSVSYLGPDMDFCSKAAFYRAAELCHNGGLHYFKVNDGQVLGDFLQHSPAETADDKDLGNHSMGAASAGLHRVGDAGYGYKIELLKAALPKDIFNDKPELFKAAALPGTVHDADEILRTWNIPGSEQKRANTE